MRAREMHFYTAGGVGRPEGNKTTCSLHVYVQRIPLDWLCDFRFICLSYDILHEGDTFSDGVEYQHELDRLHVGYHLLHRGGNLAIPIALR